jgi:hypothetical protein
MALYHITTAIAFCCTLSLFAQAPKTKLKARVSTEREMQDNLVPKAVVPTNNGRTMVVFKARDPHLDEKAAAKVIPKLELYDPAKLTLIRTIDPSEKLGKQTVVLEDLVLFQDEPVMFGTIRDLSAGELRLVYSKVDPNLTRAGRPYEEIVVYETGLTGGQVTMGRAPGRLGPLVTTSPDTRTLFFASPELRDTISGKAMFLFAAVAGDFQEQWKHIVEVEEGVERSELIDAAMDANGNAWLLIRYDHKGRKAAKGEIESEVKLFHVSSEGIRGIRFGLDRKQYVESACIRRASSGSLVVAGAALSVAEGKNPRMLFIAELPTEAMDLPTPAMFKDPFNTDGRKVEVRDMLHSENGDRFLVMEEYEYASIAHPKTLKHTMKHVHGPVHILNIGRSGAPQWNSTIRRLVHSESDYFGNVHAVVHANELSLIMLDSDKLAEKRNNAAQKLDPADANKPYTVHFLFTEKGEWKPKKIIDAGYNPTLISGKDLYPIGGDSYFGFGSSRFEGSGYLPVQLEFSH